MYYKIFFGNRFIEISTKHGGKFPEKNNRIVNCKNKKSFDKVYQEFKKDENISSLIIISPFPNKIYRHFQRGFSVIKAAGGIVFNELGEVLFIKRNNVWDLPKGKLEKGEKKHEAAIREVKEECNIQNLTIQFRIGKSLHTYSLDGLPVLKVTYWYKMYTVKNEQLKPQKDEGITDIKWVSVSELPAMINETWPNLRDILELGTRI